MPGVIEIRIEGVKKQADTLVSFATEPKGVFETADEMIKNFRSTNRQTLEQLRVPTLLRGRRGTFRQRRLL